MSTDIVALALLATVVVGLSIYFLVERRRKSKEKEAENEVSAEALTIEARGITRALPIRLFDDDVVSVTIDEVTDDLVGIVGTACKKAVRRQKTLQVIINTSGGDTIAARTICGLLKHFTESGHELRIVVMGKCYSAGMTILMAAEPEHRLAVRGSEFLIHAAKRTATGRRDARTYTFDNESTEAIAASSLVERSSLKAHLKSGKNCIFSVDDALKMNIIGGII